MPLEFEVIQQFEAKNVWSRVAPHPQRMKDNLPHHWRFHVEGRDKIFLIDAFVPEIAAGENVNGSIYSQDETASTTGMTAWIRAYGNVCISTTADGKIIAKVELKLPPQNSN